MVLYREISGKYGLDMRMTPARLYVAFNVARQLLPVDTV